IKWVDPANIHLTLSFLGDTMEERIKVAAVMLDQKCSGFGEFSFSLSGIGVFKNLHDPRVIWIGIDNYERLQELSDLIMTGLKDTSFGVEERLFRPHITIGRIKFLKNPENLSLALERYRDDPIQSVNVKELILFESILKPAGPIYKPLVIVNL
ncbi:MAG: RNA 2',3'-cyclic phosphodiesterase, partial [Bacteroidales bacterium]|nr:RNA 2',3'-cyclic phosphodiesterase [Bacteroidales bacterium]